MKRLFGCALSLLLVTAAMGAEVNQKDIEPVFVQLEQNGKEFPMIVEKDGVKYQVYRAKSEQEGQDSYYYSDKNGESHWISDKASHDFTVAYLDGEKTVSLEKVGKAAQTNLAGLKKDREEAQTQLVHWFRRWGYRYGYYNYGGYRYVGYSCRTPYYYNNYYCNNVVSYHNYYPYNGYYNAYGYNVNVNAGYYYGNRYTVCYWG